MRKVIAINGNIGAGKDTVVRLLAEKLQYKKLPTAGDFFREEAAQRGISFAELMEIVKTDESVDRRVDTMAAELLNNSSEAVMSTRVGPRFAPEVFNVFLKVDERIGAERVMRDSITNAVRAVERNSDNIEEIINKNRKRAESENYRYMRLYNYDQTDMSLYDKVYDTSYNSAEEIADMIIKDYDSTLKS